MKKKKKVAKKKVTLKKIPGPKGLSEKSKVTIYVLLQKGINRSHESALCGDPDDRLHDLEFTLYEFNKQEGL